LEQLGGGEQELRRDRPAPHSQTLFRVYLDNWDEVRKVDKALCLEVEGKPSVHQLALRQQYSDLELPRHPKKAVESSCVAEVQGALLDGRTGVEYAKPAKLIKYLGLGWELVRSGYASLKELQVVEVGFVYITMFRRPLLCTLNSVWRHMETLKGYPPVVRLAIPREVKLELVRFMALVPLAQMDFRLPMCQQVTASDASSTGGGISCSAGLTSYGQLAQQALVRGEFPEPLETVEILTIGLFDGIGALRVAADVLHLPVAGHVSVECNPAANRVLEAAFPGAIQVNHVQDIDATMVQSWACEFSSVGVVLIGAGPPCQDVSKLNVDRKGSQRGLRSSLYKEIPRVRSLVKKEMPWAQVHLFVESVASMDASDRRAAMSEDLGLVPHQVDAAEISLCRRPRLYWLTWELVDEPGLSLGEEEGSGWTATRHIHLCAEVDQKEFLEAGWFLPPGNRLATFTTSRPSERPGRRPAGLHGCDEASLKRWREDDHRFPPYQYKPEYCVHHPRHPVRVASIIEREAILGFPAGYTEQCVPKQERKSEKASDLRKTLLGNSWSVGVVACLLKQLFERLGVVPHVDVQSLINRLVPGKGTQLQMVLLRPPVRRESQHVYPEDGLARRLTGLVSVKGEDLLLQSSSEGLVKHHRLRSSIPSKLWKWKEVSGWSWRGGAEHINQLEMRAVLTTAKYWVSKKKLQGCKLLHLTDSLVVLHALSRGRSSSRKLRRTIMRINAYLLTANLHPVWTYVHTAQNPADRPSRRVISRKWGKVGSI
jgi:site-specific DNA-cytosine methylase